MTTDYTLDTEYHTKMLTSVQQGTGPHTCKPILPFPKEMTIAPFCEPIQDHKTYRFKSNYTHKLKETKCTSVYERLNMTAMKESVESGREIKPVHTIAPMKASINMFSKKNPFTMTLEEFTSIQTLSVKLPLYFNWMDNLQISRPFNQGLCGSCWAIAAATCLSDVFFVSKKTQTNPNLSPTYLLSCYPQSQCDGGDPSEAVSTMTQKGIVSSSCVDYTWCSSTGCGGDPTKHFEANNVNQYIPPCACSVSSSDVNSNTTKYYATNSMAFCIPPDLSDFTSEEEATIKEYLGDLYGNVPKSNVNLRNYPIATIQNLLKYYLYTYGPLLGGFHVFSNFMKGDFQETNGIYIENYSYSGVPGIDYNDVESSWVGSHAVVIVGWGQDTIKGEVVPYWVVRNSWGKSWGNKGTWKMAMYGNDYTKKYQNRISQFEYPSIVTLDTGVAVTGGIILMKAGNIENSVPVKSKLEEPIENSVPVTKPEEHIENIAPVTKPEEHIENSVPVKSKLEEPPVAFGTDICGNQMESLSPYYIESSSPYYQHSPDCMYYSNSLIWVYILLLISLLLLLVFIFK